MNRIVSWYNQNRKTIWIVVLSFIAVIALIQILNKYYKNNTKDESSSTNISTTTYNTTDYSIITKEKINETVSKESTDLIKDFFDYCNNGRIEEAYDVLSNECKNELYPTFDDFNNNYYKRIFTEKRSYESMLWITSSNRNTYRIEIMSDLLATGQKEYMPIEDYYTIVKENGVYKLNISSFVGKEEINVSKSQNDIDVTILCRKIYMDYEKYEIEIKNDTGNELIFNTKENSNSIYIQDKNELKYIAFLNEIDGNEFNIQNGFTKTLQIKFNRGYEPETNITKIVFEDIKSNNETEKMEIEI